MPYITPDRYKAMGFGVDLDGLGVDDSMLRQYIARATAIVDSYCAVPMQPQKFDFRGGTITGEQKIWQLGDPTHITSNSLGSRRVYPNCRPIKEITDFRVKFTNTYEVAIAPQNLYVNRQEGWAEVVSIAAIVSGVYPVGVNFGLYTPVAEFSYTYGNVFGSVGEYLEPTDAGTYRSTNCWWDTTIPPVVYINDAEQTTGYTIDYNEGTVDFTSQLMATDVVTADYSYVMPPAIAEATGLIVTKILGERGMEMRGMTGVERLKVAEVEIDRNLNRRNTITTDDQEISILLDAYIFRTVR